MLVGLLFNLIVPIWSTCAHESLNLDSSISSPITLSDGVYLSHNIAANTQHLVHFNWPVNLTYLAESTQTRKVIFHLESCDGSPVLLVRKTRRCYPDVFKCCSGGSSAPPCENPSCPWTHFSSELNGTADGAQTFMEIGLTTTDYYMTVYSRVVGNYRLLALTDVGAFPRPSRNGRLDGVVNAKTELEIRWFPAVFSPEDVSRVTEYQVYVKELEPDYEIPGFLSSGVFMAKDRVYNTVCGIQRNMQRVQGLKITCDSEKCSTIVDNLKFTRKYVFNVVVVSARGYTAAYAGLLVTGAGKQVKAVTDNDVVVMIAAACGATIFCLLLGYVYIYRLYFRKSDDRDKTN